MNDSSNKRPKLVGNFIRQRREALGLSQRALGQLFDPPVTTQFISNVERGVTPLPPAHIPTLTKALQVSEAEMMQLLEKEYTLKLTGRIGLPNLVPVGDGVPNGHSNVVVQALHFEFMRNVYDAFRQADLQTQQAFASACENLLKVTSKPGSGSTSGERA